MSGVIEAGTLARREKERLTNELQNVASTHTQVRLDAAAPHFRYDRMTSESQNVSGYNISVITILSIACKRVGFGPVTHMCHYNIGHYSISVTAVHTNGLDLSRRAHTHARMHRPSRRRLGVIYRG